MPESSTRLYFDRLARDWQSRYVRRDDYSNRIAVFQSQIQEIYRAARIEKVLEIGCGAVSMYDPAKFPTSLAIAVDVSYEMLKRNNADAHFVQADVLQLPFNIQFDMVILSSVIEWLERPMIVPEILSTVVASSGHLLISYPNFSSLLRVFEHLVIAPATGLIQHRHYTSRQVTADYNLLCDTFVYLGFALKDRIFFGKKLFVHGRYSSSMRLDVLVKS